MEIIKIISAIIAIAIIFFIVYGIGKLLKRFYKKLKGGEEPEKENMAYKLKQPLKPVSEDSASLELQEKKLREDIKKLLEQKKELEESEEEQAENLEQEEIKISNEPKPIPAEVSKQEIIDAIEGNLARTAQLMQILRRI